MVNINAEQRLPLLYRLLYSAAVSSGGVIAGVFRSHHVLYWQLCLWIPGMVVILMWPSKFGSPDIRMFLLRPFHRN